MTLAPPYPRARGEGGVRGRRRCLSCAIITRPPRHSLSAQNRGEAPSTHPSPRTRGEGAASGAGRAMGRALSFSRRMCARGLPTKATNSHRPKEKEGRRSAEKARLSRGASPRSGCCHPSALRARPRVQRNALAFRRSTAVLAPAICRNSIQAALHAMQRAGVTRTLAPRLSEAPRAPVVMPAGSMPGPPESGSDEPPPAGTAPAPSVGVTG
jgi:hypothetical protein